MDSTKEDLIKTFYSHKLHVEDMCNLQCPSESIMQTCKELISCLLEVECKDIIHMMQKTMVRFEISYGDVPQFSSLDDCVYKVPILVRDCGIDDLTYTQLGFMLRIKPRKDAADMKYGENQSKTAAQMGLCTIKNARIYPSYLGLEFCNLDKEKQKNLIPKLILFIPYIFDKFSKSVKYEDIVTSVSFLAKSTQERRLPNIWTLITQVNKVLPYELQIIRY